MMRPAFAPLLLAAALGACQTMPSGQQVADEGTADLTAAVVCCEHLSQARHTPLPVSTEPGKVVVDRQSQAFNFSGTKAYFVIFELPKYEQPWSFTIMSTAQGHLRDAALFVPRVMMLDAAFEPVRVFDEKSLRSRGRSLERTVFINPHNAAERYVALVGSSLSASIERRYSMVTSTPIVAGPVMFNLISGEDTLAVLRAAPVGEVTIEVHGR